MELLVFGLNHRTAPLEMRERWAFSKDESIRTLETLKTRLTPSEHVILSTCNRTEFYSHVPRASSPIGHERSLTSSSSRPAGSVCASSPVALERR